MATWLPGLDYYIIYYTELRSFRVTKRKEIMPKLHKGMDGTFCLVVSLLRDDITAVNCVRKANSLRNPAV
jgi:hypothetical protein